MSIIYSAIIDVRVQTDGRAYIHEQHTDDLGVIHDMTYLSEPTDDRATILREHANILSIQLQNEGI